MIALARLRLGLQAAASFAHRKPAVLPGMSGVSHLRAVTSGGGRPRAGAKRNAIEEGTALRANAVKPLENLDLHRKSNSNFVPAGGQI